MEFHIYAATGQKKIIEGNTFEPGEKFCVIKDEEGKIIWWINCQAIGFVEAKYPEVAKLVVN